MNMYPIVLKSSPSCVVLFAAQDNSPISDVDLAPHAGNCVCASIPITVTKILFQLTSLTSSTQLVTRAQLPQQVKSFLNPHGRMNYPVSSETIRVSKDSTASTSGISPDGEIKVHVFGENVDDPVPCDASSKSTKKNTTIECAEHIDATGIPPANIKPIPKAGTTGKMERKARRSDIMTRCDEKCTEPTSDESIQCMKFETNHGSGRKFDIAALDHLTIKVGMNCFHHSLDRSLIQSWRVIYLWDSLKSFALFLRCSIYFENGSSEASKPLKP
uniref:Uncharacterized protein n=1 Tax=Timema shepardi TaxID=629360 RepID=A0A7R9ANP3_TIMSH|nr:unnamed protein product [Timema shepardi]